MSTDTTVSSLRQRMIEDMAARKLGPHSRRSHIYSCKRFAAFLKRSPDTATADDIRGFQLHLVEAGLSIGNRNRIMSGVKFLFRVTLRRHDLAAEIYHLKEPQKLPLTMSPDETERLLAKAGNLKVQAMLALSYGCGLRAGEIVRLKAGDIDSVQMIIRIVQSKGRKDRHVMLPQEVLSLLREWWKIRPTRYDADVPVRERWLFPGRQAGKSGCCRAQVARRARGRTAAGRVFSCGLHAAGRAPRHRISEQDRDLRPAHEVKASAETTLAIAADPKHLGARIGIRGPPYLGLRPHPSSPRAHDRAGRRPVGESLAMGLQPPGLPRACQSVVAPIPRAVLDEANQGSHARPPQVLADHSALANQRAFKRFPAPLRKTEWVVYTKNPFAGPEQVLRYLSRYTHRIAISNRRLVSTDDNGVAFRWKDYRIDGPERWKTMTLHPHEFIRRFLSHVLPKGFHRIRHYGLFASGNRTANIARARELLAAVPPVVEHEEKAAAPDEPRVLPCPCPRCGGRMIVIEVFARSCEPTYRPTHAPTPIGIDTS